MKRRIYKIGICIVTIGIVFILFCNIDVRAEKLEKYEKEKMQENMTTEKLEEDMVEKEEIKLTQEYVCSEFGIDESEFEGVDFEDFVAYYDLSYDTIHNELVGYLLRRYKEDYGKVRTPDYRQVFGKAEEAKLTEENQDTIAIVFLSQVTGEEHHYHIFDFEIGKIIIGEGSESTILEDEIVGEADEQVKEELIELFEKYNVYSWETKPQKTRSGDIVGTLPSWSFEIKFSDNTIYRIHGDTFTDETAPESFDLFVNDLKALATSSSEE